MIRKFKAADIETIQQLNRDEGWDNLVVRHEQTLNSWLGSEAYVIEEAGDVIGCIRALTDGHVSLYICELIIRHDQRGKGYGRMLLDHIHSLYPTTRMELLATSSSKSYYENRFRPFYGFRRTYHE
ncbi:GNAT family N-acetyltransferase [Macrococcus equipercicus]|uniref:GNAT family N-acetyltransferase n=1 Tax=Macrococcus equipercicus TaxID=69967 RepID=A0A9Q9F2X1_9STAP|nr:GNAT family N-acetyltransferase [Macrococcus equipercicus]KAA1042366.1 GNAT family N-acetyltransferase [Macrococcus equipercicus]UTH14831.1 GNAT family N-acetyltransferase [Macrococcus equipercicus]